MWFNKFFGFKTRSRRLSTARSRRIQGVRTRCPMLELLETRTMLAVTWSNVGPSAISHGQVQGLGDDKVAGAVQAIAPYPDNADIIYIGTVNGGIWKTTNATEANPHWTSLTDGMPSLSIGDLALSPLDPHTIYVGTGTFSSAGGQGGRAYASILAVANTLRR